MVAAAISLTLGMTTEVLYYTIYKTKFSFFLTLLAVLN